MEEEGVQVCIYMYLLLCILAYFWFVFLRVVLKIYLQKTDADTGNAGVHYLT